MKGLGTFRKKRERPRRPLRERPADVLTCVLLVAWVGILFSPNGPAIPFLADMGAKARALYFRQFKWDDIRTGSTIVHGSPESVEIVMFTDYECPFCRNAESVLDSLRARYPSVTVGYRHVVRPNSVPSRGTALASICADRESVLPQVHRTLYDLAAISDTSFAERLRMDMHALLTPEKAGALIGCVTRIDPEVELRLRGDSTLMARLNIWNAPTFLGKRAVLVGVPALSELIRVFGLSDAATSGPGT